MKKYIEILKRTQLFSGVSDTEISAMLNCLQAKLLTFQKGDYVFREGERIDNITVLVKGKLLVQHDDFWGNRNIVNVIPKSRFWQKCLEITKKMISFAVE